MKSIKNMIDIINIDYEINAIKLIDVNTGMNNVQEYNSITFCISRLPDKFYCISYDECIKEREQILSVIKSKEDISSLVVGL